MPLGLAVEVGEEEQFILQNRAAESTTVLVLDVLVPCREDFEIGLEIVARLEELTRIELVAATVELVGAGLDLHIDGRAASHALLGVERVGDDIDRLNCVRWRDVGDVCRQV